MKHKTINAVLAKKFEDFCSSISDADVRKLIEDNTIITGGCIASMLLNEPVNDFDLYFTNMQTVEAVAKYYCRSVPDAVVESEGSRIKIKIQSAGISGDGGIENSYKYFESDVDPETIDAMKYVESVSADLEDPESKPPYKVVFMSSNAITLSGKIQLILRFYGDPDQIHENFDFIHCTIYWTRKGGTVVNLEALEALLARELRYIGSLYPICSVIRIRKFIRRGYTINAGQILKMCMQISDLDLTDIKVLEDQLIGVDVAYFVEVIQLLQKKTETGKPIDAAYLIEIIDRMF